MSAIESVNIGTLPFERFESVMDPERYSKFREAVERSRELLDGRVVWNVNSTSRGGGVAEMLVSLLAYAHGAGVNARWEVISGTDPFFALTKRIHNNLHSAPGDGGQLGEAEEAIYAEALAPNIAEFVDMVSPDDVVIVHDPQPAGLIAPLKEKGATVIWRCHVGIDTPSELSRRAWSFLRPKVEPADAYVFSRKAFVWEGLDDDKIQLIAPVIDAFSAKNQELTPETVGAILEAAGLQEGSGSGASPTFLREDGSPEQVVRQATVWEGRPLRPEDPVVLQVSRWDRLKDPIGVIQGFVDHVLPNTDAHLVYAGPDVAAVADDPEGKEVLDEAVALYEGLPAAAQERLHLVAVPMDDLEENAAIINALQRRADVVVQKSIAEGFGLTVAEGMWKARPVVATRIGGIQDQIEDGVSGVLLDDATDLSAYGAAVTGLLQDPARAHAMGEAAQERVRGEFLAVRSLMQYLDLIEKLTK
ncbi:MAG: trehalose synthase [Solirubrobacteraceae bacterium]|jgi:trehalose synthase|nr:trehalose synthase [Solirubrobacteraceae bacterium]